VTLRNRRGISGDDGVDSSLGALYYMVMCMILNGSIGGFSDERE
jgi:hypothetical protein